MGLKRLSQDIETVRSRENKLPAILDIMRLLIDEHLAYMNTEYDSSREKKRQHTVKALSVTEAIKWYEEPGE